MQAYLLLAETLKGAPFEAFCACSSCTVLTATDSANSVMVSAEIVAERETCLVIIGFQVVFVLRCNAEV